MMAADGRLDDVANLLRVIAQKERLATALALRGGPRTVTELAEAIALDAASVARHVTALRRAGLVYEQRRGHLAYYVLDGPVMLLRILRAIESDPSFWT